MYILSGAVASVGILLNLTVIRSPALVFRPVNPAAKTFSVSIPTMYFVDFYSMGVMSML